MKKSDYADTDDAIQRWNRSMNKARAIPRHRFALAATALVGHLVGHLV